MTDISLETLEEASRMKKVELNKRIDDLMDEFHKTGDIEYAMLASEYAEVYRKRYCTKED